MSSTYQIERNRGTKEAQQQLAVLREKWPLAFPAKHQDVRPLAIGAPGEIAAAMGWSLPYTLGVLAGWKMAPAYCEAVLCYDQRVALDGSSAETIDAEAKELATKQLMRLAAHETAKTATKVASPTVVKPKSDPVPPTATREHAHPGAYLALAPERVVAGPAPHSHSNAIGKASEARTAQEGAWSVSGPKVRRSNLVVAPSRRWLPS